MESNITMDSQVHSFSWNHHRQTFFNTVYNLKRQVSKERREGKGGGGGGGGKREGWKVRGIRIFYLELLVTCYLLSLFNWSHSANDVLQDRSRIILSKSI